MKESSSSRDRHRRHSSSVSKRHRKESPASTSKHRHREMASLQDFKASLKLLKGSKKVIFSLTDQAKCLGAYAQGVVNAIVEYIDSQTQSEDKMLGLFLFDSIFKNVGSPFTDIIQSRVSDIFCRIFIEAKEDVRVLLQTTRLSWNGHFPSEVLIPLDKRVRAMDPAWPDFKVTKVAGQGMSLPTPSSSSSHWHNSFVSKRHRGESPAPPSKRCRREQTQSDDKMPGLYLLDSIVKSVGQPFTEIIQSRVSDVFCRIFMQAEKDIRVLLHTTRLSWSQHFPSEVLIPLDIRVRAMDPAWPDFKVTKVAGQVVGVPAPRSSASSSRDNIVSPAVTSIHEEPSTNQLQFKLVYRGDKQRKEPWPQFTNVGDLLQRVVSPTECTTASVFLTPGASPSDVGFIPGSSEVTGGGPGQPIRNESSSSSATHQNPVISEPDDVTGGGPGQPRRNESSSCATHQNPVISEPDEVTDGSPGQPLWNESSSSSATHQNSFISEPDEVTDGSPGQPLWNESSSSSATHQNSFISEPDEVTDGSPGQPLWNESSSSSATHQNSLISEPGEVTDGSPGQPISNESSSSSATHPNPVISEPAEVTASSPRHTLMKEFSSSRDRHRRHSSSVSKRHREESPAHTSKRCHREMASLQVFKASLKWLKGSKKVMFSLTDQAKCLGAYAQGVVNAIVEYIDSQTQSEDKMLGLFLLDSIFKNVGSPFTDIIQSRVSDIFCRMFIEAKEDVRVLLQTTRLSWNGHFPSEVLIPLDKRVRAMDPAWPDFKVTKVAGQGMSLPTPSSSSSHWHNSFVSKQHRGESPAPPSKRCRREILLWRYVRALGCLLLLQVAVPMAVCNLYYTVIVQGIFNPVTVITNIMVFCISPSKLVQLIIPAICFVLLARVHVKSYTVHAWVPLSMWESWRRLFSVTVLCQSFMIALACSVLASFFASLAHPSFHFFAVPCLPQDIMCSNRKGIIMSLGFCVGIRYAYKYFIENGNVIIPAPAHPRKLQLIKANLNLQKLREACNTYGASKFSLCYCTLFSVLLTGLFGRGDWRDILQTFTFPLVAMMVLSAVLLTVTLFLFSQVFQIFIAEPIEIPLTSGEESSPNTEEDSWRLCNALSSSGLLQLLAFWDLKSLASSDPRNYHRRAQVFMISHPGGHPRNWLGIMNPSLNLIRKFTERLRRHNCPEELPKVTPPNPAGTDINKNEVAKPQPTSLKTRISKLLQSLKRYQIFGYFLSELPDAVNRSIFVEALPVIWAVHALGDLAAASFTEDKFGVVQRNIPDILMAFTQLQKVLDNLGRATITRRANTAGNYQLELKLRKALRASLRSALYTITTTFGPTVLEMQVSADCQNKLKSYLEFKEG
ncbi:uncharacterized protein LOC126998905 isoform X2 [Eriocheir sinensis]|uniref:uncharacterized protein LOC126998905 isoform X2 n=1 Tax=Eriocheir sinensis TaxID=95602 RepID=UPI0021C905CF|nr:uncharacterized protein LOC126998905 isoform X2 [Eriocheir sinensis]